MGTGASVVKDFDEIRQEILNSYRDEWEKFYSYNYPKIPAEEWYSKIETGDLLLFKCMQKSSAFYKEMQGSLYSHVGIVLKRDGVPYVYESSVNEFIVDVDLKSVQNGLMLSPLKERLYDFFGVICWRSLSVPNRQEGEFETILETIIKEYKNRYYDDSQREKIIILLHLQHQENLNRFFCSELVARCYQRLGLLSTDRDSNSYIVPDFSSIGYEVTSKTKYRQVSPQDAMIKLLRNATLSTEMELIPHWVTVSSIPTQVSAQVSAHESGEDTNHQLITSSPKMADLLEEDLHFLNGLGITKQEVEDLTDSKFYILIETIHGIEKGDFGHEVDNWIEHLFQPLHSNNLIIQAAVGQIPVSQTIPYERCVANLKLGEVSSLLWITNCQRRPELQRLKIWISIRETDLFSKGEYMGAICLDPSSVPVIEKSQANSSTQEEKIITQFESETDEGGPTSGVPLCFLQSYDGVLDQEKILKHTSVQNYSTQQGYWGIRCWIEK